MNAASPVTVRPFEPSDETTVRTFVRGLHAEDAPTHVLIVVADDAPADWSAQSVIEIADALSRGSRPVVLADFSVARPVLQDVLGIPNDEGLTDHILFGASLERVETYLPEHGFRFLPAGPSCFDAGPVLRSPQLRDLIARYGARGDTLVAYLPAATTGVGRLVREFSTVFLGSEEAATAWREQWPSGAELHALRPLEPGEIGPKPTPEPEAGAPGTTVPTTSTEDTIGMVEAAAPEDGQAAAGEAETFESEAEASAPTGEEYEVGARADAGEEGPTGATEPQGAEAPQTAEPVATEMPQARARWERAFVESDAPVSHAAANEADVEEDARPDHAVPVWRRPAVVGVAVVVLVVVAIVSMVMIGGDDQTATAAAATDEAGTPPAAVQPTTPVDVSSLANLSEPLTHSVAVEAHPDFPTARSRLGELRSAGMGPGFFISPVVVGGATYYRVMAGPLADSASAALVMDQLIDAGLKSGGSSWDVRWTPYTYLVAEYDTRAEADARMSALMDDEIPTYIIDIPYEGGHTRYAVVAGAYQGPIEAGAMGQILRDGGVRDSLVERTGRAGS